MAGRKRVTASERRKHSTVSQRLARFGLAHLEKELQDLRVQRGDEVHIDPQNRDLAKRIVVLDVGSADDFKRLIGVPHGAVGQASPVRAHPTGFVSTDIASPFPFFPAVPLNPELGARLWSYMTSNVAAAKQTPTEKTLRAQLNKAIIDAGIKLSVFLASDIYVEAGATLVVDDKVQTLFANHIIMEDGATIRMDGFFTQLDCASIKRIFVRGKRPRPILKKPPMVKKPPIPKPPILKKPSVLGA